MPLRRFLTQKQTQQIQSPLSSSPVLSPTALLLKSVLSKFHMLTPSSESRSLSLYIVGSLMQLVSSNNILIEIEKDLTIHFTLLHAKKLVELLQSNITHVFVKHVIVLCIWGAARYEPMRFLLGTEEMIRTLVQIGKQSLMSMKESSFKSKKKRMNKKDEQKRATHANITNAVLGCLQLLLSNEQVRSSFSNDTTDGTKVLVSLIVDALEHAPQATGKIHHLMLSSHSSSLRKDNSNSNDRERNRNRDRNAKSNTRSSGGAVAAIVTANQRRPQSAASSRTPSERNRNASSRRPTTAGPGRRSQGRNQGRSQGPSTGGLTSSMLQATNVGSKNSSNKIELGSIGASNAQTNVALQQGLTPIPECDEQYPSVESQTWTSAIKLGWLLIRSSPKEVIEMVKVNIPETLLRLTLCHRKVHSSVRGAAASLLQLFMSTRMRKRLINIQPLPGNIGKERHFNELLVITLLLLSRDEDTQAYAAREIARLAIGGTMKTLLRTMNAVPALLTLARTRSPHSLCAEYGAQAILNLSTSKTNQKYLGKKGFNLIVNVATHPTDSMTRTYARRTILNLAKHSANRTKIYKLELRLKKNMSHGIKQRCDDEDLAEQIWKTTGTGPYDKRGKSRRKHASTKKQKKNGSSTKQPLLSPRTMFEEWCDTTFSAKTNDAMDMSNTMSNTISNTISSTMSSNGFGTIDMSLADSKRNNSAYNSLPQFRPRSPNFLTEWKLSRPKEGGGDKNTRPGLDVTIQSTDLIDQDDTPGSHILLHSMRRGMQDMFRGDDDDGLERKTMRRSGSDVAGNGGNAGRGKSSSGGRSLSQNGHGTMKRLGRPKSAVQLRRQKVNASKRRSRWAPKVDHYEMLDKDGLFVETEKESEQKETKTEREKYIEKKEKKNKTKASLRPSSPTVRVILHPPLQQGNAVKFADNGMHRSGPPRLCRWEYIEGNHISDVCNFPTYVFKIDSAPF